MSSRSTHAPWGNRYPAVVAVTHALVLIGFLSWRFGGMEPFSRGIAGWIVAAAPCVTVWAWRESDRRVRRRFLHFAVPLFVLALVVLAGALNPHMQLLSAEGQPLGLIAREYRAYLPSLAWPAQALPDFLLNAGLVLVGLNLFLARPSRGLQRILLGAIAVNAAALAAVGTVFKLGQAKLIFGIYPSPNPNFFASFFYYNHWGAFALLGLAAAASLALYYRQSEGSNWLHTPAPLLGVLAVLLFLSVPLAGGRASLLGALALALFLGYRLIPRRADGRLSARGLAGAAMVFAVLAAGTFWLARDRIALVLGKTQQQVSYAKSGQLPDARLAIYRETWKLFRERPAYGWGWLGFRHAVYGPMQGFNFKMQNEQKQNTVVLDAHNDWLQFLSELGLVGAGLSLAAVVGLVRVASLKRWTLAPSLELVAGFVAVSLMACLDFPFACPAVVVTAWTLLATGAAIAFDREKPSAPPA